MQKGPALWLFLLVCTVLFAAITGCKEKKEAPAQLKQKIVQAGQTGRVDPKAPPGTGKNPDAQKPEPLPLKAPKPDEPVSAQSPRSKRDPFRSFIEIKTHVQPVKKVSKIRTPLERYSLDQLKVVGILKGPNLRRALVEDDVGKGYVVNRGDAIGNKSGRIAVIKSDRIIIEEAYQDALGKRKVRKITKRLYSADERLAP